MEVYHAPSKTLGEVLLEPEDPQVSPVYYIISFVSLIEAGLLVSRALSKSALLDLVLCVSACSHT